MSLDIKGQKCAVCGEEFTETDDVVYCPICGAPHHRECYASLGKCGLEAEHGKEPETEKEAVPEEKPTEDMPAEETPKEENTGDDGQNEATDGGKETSGDKICPSCGETVPSDTRFCPFCGVPVTEPPFGVKLFELPTIDRHAVIEEGVTAGDAAKVVYMNPFRYISVFLKLKDTRKISWNWAAFLMPGAWLAYRKMYKESVAVTALLITVMLLNVPFNLAVDAVLPVTEGGMSIMTMLSSYAEYLPAIGVMPLVLVGLGMLSQLIIHIFVALYGDHMYKKRVVSAVRSIKEAEDEEEAQAKYSGVSFFGFILAFSALQFLPSLISMLIF